MKKNKVCPITGEIICDRTYNKSAKYSKKGFKEHRKEYLQNYYREYGLTKKLLGIGLIKEKENGNWDFDRKQQ